MPFLYLEFWPPSGHFGFCHVFHFHRWATYWIIDMFEPQKSVIPRPSQIHETCWILCQNLFANMCRQIRLKETQTLNFSQTWYEKWLEIVLSISKPLRQQTFTFFGAKPQYMSHNCCWTLSTERVLQTTDANLKSVVVLERGRLHKS